MDDVGRHREREPHPVPVWVASSTRHPGGLRRAAAHDGIFALADHTLGPEEVRDIIDSLEGAGARPHHPYDVVIAGDASPAWERPNPDGIDLAALGQAGATWWLESLIHLDPLALSLEVVDAGPP